MLSRNMGSTFALGCLEKGLASFRKKCMEHHYFVDSEAKEEELGPPGRVFKNECPEISPDHLLYTVREFPVRNHAMHCCRRGYFCLPVFEEHNHKRVGVLEFIGFSYSELGAVGQALQVLSFTLLNANILLCHIISLLLM